MKTLPDMAICGCGWVGPVIQCEREQEQDTWEFPTYMVDICPKCGEIIEEYDFSEDMEQSK